MRLLVGALTLIALLTLTLLVTSREPASDVTPPRSTISSPACARVRFRRPSRAATTSALDDIEAGMRRERVLESCPRFQSANLAMSPAAYTLDFRCPGNGLVTR
jgi:hypothetical protein